MTFAGKRLNSRRQLHQRSSTSSTHDNVFVCFAPSEERGIHALSSRKNLSRTLSKLMLLKIECPQGSVQSTASRRRKRKIAWHDQSSFSLAKVINRQSTLLSISASLLVSKGTMRDQRANENHSGGHRKGFRFESVILYMSQPASLQWAMWKMHTTRHATSPK